MAMPPLAVTVPVPPSVPMFRVSKPPTVMSPAPFSVPPVKPGVTPLNVRVLLIVESVAIESVPPVIVKGCDEVSL